MSRQDNWQPSCSMEVLQVRAAMLHAARMFFHQRGYLEVETPCLSRDIVIDAWLEPMVVEQGGQRWFLQTSPEACMKRLLAAGSGSIFQISRVFRSDESGTRHNPEFTMIEWYGVESTWQQQMELTEWLVRACLAAAANIVGYTPMDLWPEGEFRQTTYQVAFQRVFDLDIYQSSHSELLRAAAAHHVPLPDSCRTGSRDDLLNAMLAFAIEPSLGRDPQIQKSAPEFLCDYPASQAALAVTSETVPSVARRFELYIDGLELCNGYQELTDADELKRRETLQNSVRSSSSLNTLPGSPRLNNAMKAGLPACSGVALGFDRLVMIATNAATIAEVLAFPPDRV